MKNFGKGSLPLKRRERYCEILFWTDIRPVSNRQTACFRINIRQGGGEGSMAVREADRWMGIAAEKRGRTGSLGSDRE